MLDAAGCYRRRDDAIRTVLPEFGEGWACKLVIDPDMRARGLHDIGYRRAVAGGAREERRRLSATAYQARGGGGQHEAAHPQRSWNTNPRRPAELTRVAGTAEPVSVCNDQGFFVKNWRRRRRPEADRASLQVRRSTPSTAHLGCPTRVAAARRRPTPGRCRRRRRKFYFAVPTTLPLDLCLFSRSSTGVDPRRRALARGDRRRQVGGRVEGAFACPSREVRPHRCTTGPMTVDPIAVAMG